ncbi:MAG: Maf family protein [Erysipelotrichaceae bacterium]
MILASKSPRRKELFKLITNDFEIREVDIDETLDSDSSIVVALEKLALKKAQAITSDDLIIAADTVVVYQNKIFGKPKDKKEAVEMLSALSGNTHHVISAVAMLRKNYSKTFTQITEVCFYPLTLEEINDYIDKYQPYDKAGAYGIQDGGALLIEEINGDYYNVMGLPIARLNRELLNF